MPGVEQCKRLSQRPRPRLPEGGSTSGVGHRAARWVDKACGAARHRVRQPALRCACCSPPPRRRAGPCSMRSACRYVAEAPGVDEDVPSGTPVEDAVRMLALRKARAVAARDTRARWCSAPTSSARWTAARSASPTHGRRRAPSSGRCWAGRTGCSPRWHWWAMATSSSRSTSSPCASTRSRPPSSSATSTPTNGAAAPAATASRAAGRRSSTRWRATAPRSRGCRCSRSSGCCGARGFPLL